MLNKKQLVILTAAVLVIGLVFIKQVSAQWQNPGDLPGQGTINPPLTNPLGSDLNLNSNDITNVGTITSNEVCIGVNCETAWPGGDVTNPMTANLDAGQYTISNIKSPTPGNGSTNYGLSAFAGKNSDSVNGTVTVGVYGYTDGTSVGTSYGLYGLSQHNEGTAVYGVATKGWAGYFTGPWGASGDGQISGGDLDILYDAGPKTGGNLYVEKKITSAEYCIGVSCITSWLTGGVTGSGTTNYLPKWSSSTGLNNSVIYQTSNKIGIGTITPNKKLHVYDVSANAEIDIQSTAAASSWWGIYHNASSDDLVFWKNAADRFTFTDDGKFGVGVVPTVSIQTTGAITATGNVTAAAFLYSSDARLKTNVKTIINPLLAIKSLRGVTFNWEKNGQPSLGFIAQEVEQVLPQLVHEQEGQKYLEYGNITAVLVEAVKVQQQQIEELKAEIEQLKK